MAADNQKPQEEALIILAGGCFWCLEPPFDNQEGVLETIVGYIGGSEETANYENVSRGTSGHREAVAVHYDPAKVNVSKLLKIFFDNIDPFDAQGQFVDKGPQYTTAIYYSSKAEKEAAEKAVKR